MTDILIAFGIQNAATVLSMVVAFVGVCALITALIVEGLKSIEQINQLPTKLICYGVALVITPISFLAVMAYAEIPIEWYMIFGSFLAAFVVAKVSMNGWDDVTELAQRMLRK